MNGSKCDLAREQSVVDEEWRRHAASCPDCGEILKVGDWMNKFAGNTAVPRTLPSPGLLLFKAKLRERLSSSNRAERPIRAMAFIALFIAVVSTGGAVFGTESRFGSIMSDAFGMVTTYAVAIAVAAVAVAVICVSAGYLIKGPERRDERVVK